MKPEDKLKGELVTPDRFSIEVERAVHEGEAEGYLQCIVEKAEQYDIDIESIKPYLTPTLVEKLRVEAQRLNLLKDKNTTASIAALFFGS